MSRVEALHATLRPPVLVVDDDPLQQGLIVELLAQEGLAAQGASNAAEAIESIARNDFAVVILDLRLPDGEGSNLIERVVAAAPKARVIINTGFAELETAKDAVNLGAFAYLEKGGDAAELIVTTLRGLRDFAESRVAEAEGTLRSIVTHAPDLIAEVTAEGLVVSSNRPNTNTDGRVQALLPPTTSGLDHTEHIARCLSLSEPVAFECEGTTAVDGGHRVLSVRVAPIMTTDDAGPHRAVLIARDITNERAAERRLKEREEQLRQSQKMEAIGSLAGGVAHDFNNLLIAIQAFAGVAAKAVDIGHPAAEPIGRIREATEQAVGITQALLTYTRKRPLQREPLDITAVVRGAAAIVERALPANVRLVTDLAEERTAVVIGDETRVQQVIMNLAINARDAMRRGGMLRISTAVDPGDSGVVLLRVADTGIGMTESVRARIFEPYFTTRPRGQGTGLGLSIIQGIVEDMHGTIDVESTPGKGTVFTLRFARSENAVPPARTTARGNARDGVGRAVLVNSDEHVRRVIALMLGSMGFEVDQRQAGEDARAAFDASDPPRVVVLDADAIGEQTRSLATAASDAGCPRVVILHESPGDDAPSKSGNDAITMLAKPFRRRDLEAAIGGTDADQ